MLLKDIKTGESCIVEKIYLPFLMEQRLESLGMTKDTVIIVKILKKE